MSLITCHSRAPSAQCPTPFPLFPSAEASPSTTTFYQKTIPFTLVRNEQLRGGFPSSRSSSVSASVLSDGSRPSQRNVCPSHFKMKFSVSAVSISSASARTLFYHLYFLQTIYSFIFTPLFCIRKCMEFKQCCGPCADHHTPCSSTFRFPFTLRCSCSASIRHPSLYSQVSRALSSITFYFHSTSIPHQI